MSRFALTLVSAVLAFVVQGCFTGVESTPKIGNSELKKQNASEPTAERLYLADVATEPLSRWQRGKSFMVEDPKAMLNFGTSIGDSKLDKGDIIEFAEALPALSPTGEATDLVFVKRGESDSRLVYRINASQEELNRRDVIEVPFTVELGIAERLRGRLLGNTYYIMTPRWLDRGLKTVTKLKYIPVRIVDVLPGNSDFPVRIEFQPIDDALNGQGNFSVYMSVGDGHRSTRNFEHLFALGNPRDKYQAIDDNMWRAIVESRLVKGMTRDQARLSLGSPNDVLRGHDYSSAYERWEYDGGVFLLFRDGLLEDFRK